VAQRTDDALDLGRGHAVCGFPIGPGGHRPIVRVDAPVGQQIQPGVGQLPVQLIARQAAPAAVTEDTQHRFGVLHYAILPAFGYPVT
jgi:hypothetical protein